MVPQRFFDEALPELVARSPQAFAARRGSIAFVVPPGGWTVQLGNTQEPVTPLPRIDADLVLRFDPSALEAWLNATLDLDQAIADRRVVAEGDLALLESFGLFLAGGSGHNLRSM